SCSSSAPRCKRSIRMCRRGTIAFASSRRNVFVALTRRAMLPASLRSVEAARASRARGSSCASGPPALDSTRVLHERVHGSGLPRAGARRPASRDRGGGLGMAEDDPSRESPGLNPEEETPAPEGLYARGTAGRILKMLKYPDQSVRILVQGLRRIEIAAYTQREPYFRARVRHLQDRFEPSKDLDAVQAHMVNQFAKFVSMIPYLPDELQVVVMNIKDPGKVTDLIASNLNISLEEKQDLLSTLDVRARLEK